VYLAGEPGEDQQLCVRADQRHAVCHYLLPDPAVRQPAFAAVLLCRQYLRLVCLVAANSQQEAELQIRWLPLPKAIAWFVACVVAIGLMTVFINPVFAFLTRIAVSVMSGSA
jgi:hypothetical protein